MRRTPVASSHTGQAKKPGSPTNRSAEPSAIARLPSPGGEQQASPGHAEQTLPSRSQPARMRRQRSADEGGAERRQRQRERCCMQLPDELERGFGSASSPADSTTPIHRTL